MSVPDSWQPRHVEAYRALRRRDFYKLLKLCGPEIKAEAKKLSGEAEDLRQAGAIGVLKAAQKYDPSRGPFQPYARTRIQGEMLDSLTPAADTVTHIEAFSPHDYYEEVLEPEERIAPALPTLSIEEWQGTLPGLGRPELWVLQKVLNEVRPGELSEDLFRFLYLETTVLLLVTSGPAGSPVEISGPMHLLDYERQRARQGPFKAPLSGRELGKLLGVDEATVRKWRKRIRESGPPPGRTSVEVHADYYLALVDRNASKRHRKGRGAG